MRAEEVGLKKSIKLRLKKEGKIYRCNEIDTNITINHPF